MPAEALDITRLLNWRAVLLYTHRWLGIVGQVLFVGWFLSGIVMMYARMPALAREERLARAAELDVSAITVSPADAARIAGARGTAIQVTMRGERPVYRFGRGEGDRTAGGGVVFADTGQVAHGVDLIEARDAARRFEPDYRGVLRFDTRMTGPDQWTLQARTAMPLYRFALDDAAGTRLYVSEATGEVVLRTTSRERFWAYLGPVVHWVYFTPLRRNGPLWNEVIVWSSVVGLAMCASGLIWGLVRFSATARFRRKGEAARSPYSGLLKWHHYAGLLFGVVTLTWTYSGLLSMEPFNWFQPVGGGRQPRAAAAGERSGIEAVSLESLRAAHALMSQSFAPKSLELMSFQGELFWRAERPPSTDEADLWRSPSLSPRSRRPELERRYVSVTRPLEGDFDRFSRARMVRLAQSTMPGVPVEDAVWLDDYDGYYYDATVGRGLPVLRVRYADPQRTWLYLDPGRGAVVQRLERTTRLRRWLYQGLHSLDFPLLYYRRPLWDIVVIALSLGGLVLSATTLVPAWLRLKRHADRVLRRIGRRRALKDPMGVSAADP